MDGEHGMAASLRQLNSVGDAADSWILELYPRRSFSSTGTCEFRGTSRDYGGQVIS